MTEVERTERYPVLAEELWEALTDPALLEEWFGALPGESDADIDIRPGGTMRFGAGEHARTAVIDEVDPGRRLTFNWSDGDDAPGSRVEIDVVELDDGESELRVREALVDEVDQIDGIDGIDEIDKIDVELPRFPIGFQPPRALARA
jgi:uncharacterized protein YndB with AHSA1/START domain